MLLESAREEILLKVNDVLKRYPGGKKFFDALDTELIKNASPCVINALFEMVPPNHFLVLSGKFGKKIAHMISTKELPSTPYFLFEGGIRLGALPALIKKVGPKKGEEKPLQGVFVDDSIYGGATYKALKSVFKDNQILEMCLVIYDGCPAKKSDVNSLFRYYDHFEATPNFNF